MTVCYKYEEEVFWRCWSCVAKLEGKLDVCRRCKWVRVGVVLWRWFEKNYVQPAGPLATTLRQHTDLMIDYYDARR